jgi:hypothetical protein
VSLGLLNVKFEYYSHQLTGENVDLLREHIHQNDVFLAKAQTVWHVPVQPLKLDACCCRLIGVATVNVIISIDSCAVLTQNPPPIWDIVPNWSFSQ